jgi:hypothetical protein
VCSSDLKINPASSAITTAKVEITLSDLNDVIGNENVENVKIETSVGEVTLSTKALESLAEEAGDGSLTAAVAVERKAAPESDSGLSDAQKEAVGGEDVREVYDVSLLIDNEKLEDFRTDGTITIGLPYELDEEKGEVGERVLSVYVAKNGDTEPMREGRKYERGMSIFKTNHLSVYAVTYEPRSGDSGGCGVGTGFAALAFLGGAMIVTRRRPK